LALFDLFDFLIKRGSRSPFSAPLPGKHNPRNRRLLAFAPPSRSTPIGQPATDNLLAQAAEPICFGHFRAVRIAAMVVAKCLFVHVTKQVKRLNRYVD
jgi:hypothetical protein